MRFLRMVKRVLIPIGLGIPFLLSLSLLFYPFFYDDRTNGNDKHFEPNNLYNLHDLRMEKVRKSCSFLSDITLEDELNFELPHGWKVAQVIVLIRHGDRGPLRMVRQLDQLDCDELDLLPNHQITSNYDQLIDRLLVSRFQFVKNLSQEYYHIPEKRCHLGHLTRLGIGQHIKLGSSLAGRYRQHLSPDLGKSLSIISTRYPRTYQSAWSFAFGVAHQLNLDLADFNELAFEFTEGHFFCGGKKEESSCQINKAAMARFIKLLQTSKILDKSTNQALKEFISLSREILAPDASPGTVQSQYHSIVSINDGFKAYFCHQAMLPCRQSDGKCLTMDKYRRLAAYLDHLGRIFATSENHHKLSFLRSHSLLRRLFDIARDPANLAKLWLFSGHDLTLESISSALGFYDGSIPPYASRLVVEVFHVSESGSRSSLLRFIYNGKDVTKSLAICRVEQLCVQYGQLPSHYFVDVFHFGQYLSKVYDELSSNASNHSSPEHLREPVHDEIDLDFVDI